MTMLLLCVCDEEWCYCTNRVEVEVDLDTLLCPVPDKACAACAAGQHRLDADWVTP